MVLFSYVGPAFERSFYTVSESEEFVEVCVTFRADPSMTVTANLKTEDLSAISMPLAVCQIYM